jgi:hypothetical protein
LAIGASLGREVDGRRGRVARVRVVVDDRGFGEEEGVVKTRSCPFAAVNSLAVQVSVVESMWL